MKRFHKRLPVVFFLLSLIFVFLFGAERYKWITVGSLQNFYYDTGTELEEVVYGQQQWGYTWDAFYRDQDMQTAKGMWIGAKDYYDPVMETTYLYKVVHNGPRTVSGGDSSQFIPFEFRMIAPMDHPEVYVKGNLACDMINGDFDKIDDIDEIDRDLPMDRLIYNKVNTSMGLSFTRKVSAISQKNYDNIHIIEYEFENTGIYDADGNIYTQILEDVYFQWQWQDAISQEGCWNGAYTALHKHWISTSVRDVRWGYSMMYDVIGDDQDNPTTVSPYEDMTGLDALDNEGNWMRGYISWMGKWDDFGYDNIGSPNVVGISHNDLPALNDGRLGAAQYKGVVVIHADKSTSDHNNDLSQPRSNSYINRNSFHNFTSGLDQYDTTAMRVKYNDFLANGNMGSHAEQVWQTTNGDAGDYSQNTSAAGYCQVLAFGPYDIAPGEKIKIVYAECADGIGHDYGYEIGKKWMQARNGNTLTVIDPNNPTGTMTINSSNCDNWKDAMVYSGRDSLVNTFRNAINIYKNNFDIPKAPPPPERVDITSTKNGINITWEAENSLSNPYFDGFRIYRTKSAKDSVYEKILDCSYSDDNINDFKKPDTYETYEFIDTLTLPGEKYYYYIVSYDDGTSNDIYPGVPLESSPFYTRTNIPVSPSYTDAIAPTQGDGTKADPYHIENINNLYWMFQHPEECDKYYIQTQDIDASETWEWIGDSGWYPIPEFSGVYDGQGFSIDSLYIDRGDTDYIGLFASINNAEVRNLGLTNVNIFGENYAGALACSVSASIIENCYSTGNIHGSNYTGGLIGYNSISLIINCYSRCNVEGESMIGGLIGNNNNAVNNCYSTGIITGTTYTGGLIGKNSGNVKHCFWDTETSGQSNSEGGTGKTSIEMKDPLTYAVVGWNFSDIWTIESSINDGYPVLLASLQDQPIKIVGIDHITKNSAVIYIDNIQNATEFGICWNSSGDPDLRYNSVNNASGKITQDTSGIYSTTVESLNENTIYYVRSFVQDNSNVTYGNVHIFRTSVFTGSGSEDDPCEISTLDQLQWIGDHPDYWNKHFIQINDIDASSTMTWNDGKGWLPIGIYNGYLASIPFSGNYNGQGYVIRNLFINSDSENYLGLFGYTDSCQISNLTLEDISVKGDKWVGGLIGENNNSDIINCHCSGSVNGNNYTGGLLGFNSESTIMSCSYQDTVTGYDYTGGLIGRNVDSDILDCYSSANINGHLRVGGLIGWCSSSLVKDCYNVGQIDALIYAGGLIGYSYKTNIINTYSTGSISGGRDLGGLIGYNYTSTVTGSFWDIESSGISRSSGGTGKTSSSMKLESTYTDSGWNFTDTWMIDAEYNNGYPTLKWQVYGVGIDETMIPQTSLLDQNYPNPFNPTTTIGYDLSKMSNIELVIYDIAGRKVKTLFTGNKCAGHHKIIWDASNLSSGVYFYRLKTDNYIETKKMVFMK